MKKLKIGVIGIGHMGTNHVRNLAGDGRFDLVGIYDADLQQAKRVADKYKISAYVSLDELLDELDAVVVAVPSSLHIEIGLRVAEHGVHALIEKPLATNVEDASVLIEAFKKNKLKLSVGHIERFNPVMVELDKIISSEDVICLEAHRYSPFSGSGRITDTSVVEDLMIHDIELVTHLMSPFKVTDIRGNGESVKTDNIDFATCMLNFGETAHAIINASRISQNKERMIVIHTAESCIRADLLSQTLTITKSTLLTVDAQGTNTYRQDGIVQHIFVPREEPLRAELLAFYQAVVEDAPVIVTGETAMRAIEICDELNKRIKC